MSSRTTFTPLVCIVDFHHARGPEIEQWFGLADPSPTSGEAAEEHGSSGSNGDHTEAKIDDKTPGAAPPPSLNLPDWHLIPYMALPDGAHQSDEEFSYFSLIHRPSGVDDVSDSSGLEPSKEEGQAGVGVDADAEGMEQISLEEEDAAESTETGLRKPRAREQQQRLGHSIFGISCARQLDASELLYRPPDVTRSAVQKAVVVLTSKPQTFSALREKLRVVTRAWFAQKDFRGREILEAFQESLAAERDYEDEQDFGLSLREVVQTFRWQTLTLFKSLLLQPKMLFFGSNCERICQVQFSLLSLIPGLVRNLQDCADPQMNSYAETVKAPDGVRTSDRASLLKYMGVPLQIFGKGSIFGPYTPLQQLDTLTDQGTQSYVVGSTNSLLLSQKARYCDVLVNLDDNTVSILSPHLRPQLTLSAADRRWIDFVTQAVTDTWDEADPSRPSTYGYAGSEEFIRLQFEEYLLAMLSSAAYHDYLQPPAPQQQQEQSSVQLTSRSSSSAGTAPASNTQHHTPLTDIEGDPSADFVPAFLAAWRTTTNHALWARLTGQSTSLFDLVAPRHPSAGALSLDDFHRRLTSQVAELHLDERLAQTRDVVGRRLADGKLQVSSAFNRVWADIEVMREAQRKKNEDAAAATAAAQADSKDTVGSTGSAAATTDGSADVDTDPSVSQQQRFSRPDLSQAQASVAAAGQRASAYFSSWGTWASDKRKTGWRSNNAE